MRLRAIVMLLAMLCLTCPNAFAHRSLRDIDAKINRELARASTNKSEAWQNSVQSKDQGWGPSAFPSDWRFMQKWDSMTTRRHHHNHDSVEPVEQ